MFIKIIPFDTLFFRTGRPFVSGEDTWADVVFPPSPSTLYGAIRSFMIFKRGNLKDFYDGKYKDDIGTTDSKGSLRITGPFLFKDEVFFKAPLDLVSDDNELKPLRFCEKPSLFISNYNLENVLIWQKKEIVGEPQGWLSLIEFCDYLKNKKESYLPIKNEDLFCYEPKIGIKRDKTALTSEEGHLYRIPLIRLKNRVSLIAEVEGLNDFPERGIIQVGGESKGAFFEKIDDPIKSLKEMTFNFENGLFKIYLATPAVFEKGWIPEWIDENKNFEGSYNGIKLKLLGCAVGKPLNIGGWELAKNKPKPMRKVVPAGSIYYFEILDENQPEKIKEAFHLKNISDKNPEEGFGFAILGEVKL